MLDQNHQKLTPFRFTVDILHKTYQVIETKKKRQLKIF